jgi:hypothetical protein
MKDKIFVVLWSMTVILCLVTIILENWKIGLSIIFLYLLITRGE